ncbi:hypothetical protein TNIN_415301 [Trichonephila inaurata madagascariensis]|uniref:Uncharacterized protein n=1 Tax=Trichonephila inaurata madagascariensis TaxID=2747483 RepID=A0A8X6X9M7_9ARAC|nr:hypothetical protein TNIN_415301 [Trichonephila inaurata madagascariensis]
MAEWLWHRTSATFANRRPLHGFSSFSIEVFLKKCSSVLFVKRSFSLYTSVGRLYKAVVIRFTVGSIPTPGQ